MRAFLAQAFRVVVRLLWLAGEILLALLDFVINVIFRPKVPLARARALWLQQTCRRVLRVAKVKVKTQGTIPLNGLLVCNHPGYLDILVISAVAPAVFIASSEVKRWPIFGLFATMAGTLFTQRTKRSDVTRLNGEVAHVLDAGGLVVLFPEGATSEGSHVVPFRSSLLEPAARLKQSLSAACISYSGADGDFAFLAELKLGIHLLKLLARTRTVATVSFTRLERGAHGRKDLARRLHSHVLGLKDSAAPQAVA
jgi:lyso-ornithine lipid O-acyltransferase